MHARVKPTHPDITPIVNFIGIIRKSSLIAYLHAQLVSQSVSFMMTRGLRIMKVFDKTLRYTYSHMLEIIASTHYRLELRSWKTISDLIRVSFSASNKSSSDNFQVLFFASVYLFARWKRPVVNLNVVYNYFRILQWHWSNIRNCTSANLQKALVNRSHGFFWTYSSRAVTISIYISR